MSVVYTWIISQLDCIPNEDGYQNVVQTVHWRLDGTEDGYGGNVYGTAVLPGPGQPFTNYEDLTQDQIVGWVEEALGPERVLQFQENIVQQIANQVNPSIVTPPLPWQT